MTSNYRTDTCLKSLTDTLNVLEHYAFQAEEWNIQKYSVVINLIKLALAYFKMFVMDKEDE